VRCHALQEHRSSGLGIDLVWYGDGLGRFDDPIVSEAALATGEPADSLPFVEVGDRRSDLHDQAYALDPSQIRRRNGSSTVRQSNTWKHPHNHRRTRNSARQNRQRPSLHRPREFTILSHQSPPTQNKPEGAAGKAATAPTEPREKQKT
jgi:hypothetical protein